MSESEFYMQCEEEELAPCQSNTEETNQMENIYHVHNGHTETTPGPSVSPAPAIKTSLVVAGSVVPQSLLTGVLQSIRIAAGGTNGQPILITSKLPAGTQQNITAPVGYILPTGQAVTFLTPTQAGSLISSHLASQARTPPPAGFQIPVTIIQNPPAVQTTTMVTSIGMTAVSTSPSTSLPLTTPAVLEPPSTSSSSVRPPPPATNDQARNELTQLQSTNNTLADGNTENTSEGPTQVSKTSTRTRKSVSTAKITTKVFQSVFKAPQACLRCNVPYKVVKELRGYMCHCNPELINNVHALVTKPRKRPRRRSDLKRSKFPVSTMSPNSSSMPPSGRNLAGSPPPCLKRITMSEIPQGTQTPGTGDYDTQGRLIMLVEDFYYGKDPGNPVLRENNVGPIKMKCHLCDKKLKNNIKLMNHMKHHAEMEQQRDDGKSHTMCPHCFRNFSTPFLLQCHLETVHSQVESASICKICELSFENTPLFLHHMQNLHRPGEMPYVCQVCKFRSSFYNDVIIHFHECHKDTTYLLCPYCMKVFKNSNSYQIHFNKHQKKSVLYCKKCRLQFLYAKDTSEHKLLFHLTHLKPVQLQGLKPGTKIIIRAYSLTKVNDSSCFTKPCTDSENSSASSVPVPQNTVQRITSTKKRPIESMLDIMTKFQKQCEPSRGFFCIECNFEIPDFSLHFPTFVHCSLCRYSTCCSRAYANHMISNHVSRKTTTKYLNLYKPCPELGKLSCTTCGYSTETGDLMATHLTKNSGHTFSHCIFGDGFSRGYKRFAFIPTVLIRKVHGLSSGIVQQKQVMQVDQNSGPQPTNPLPYINRPIKPHSANTPSTPSGIQAVSEITVPDENCGAQSNDLALEKMAISSGTHTQVRTKDQDYFTVAQLKIILYALCFGIPQAASQFDVQPDEVHSLLLKCQVQCGPPNSREGLSPQASDQLAEWMLCQREQQLPVDEICLFSKASQFINTDRTAGISYSWAVDFLINHDLSLQSLATSRRLLPDKVQERLQTFTAVVNKQVTSNCLGLSAIAAMDELSIFVDMEQLDPGSADSSSMMSAFKLVGKKDPLLDVVLASLADGTILPTVVFLRGDHLSPDAPTMPDILLEAKPEGFSNEERLQLWIDKVWHRHVQSKSGDMGLLVMDQYRGHLNHRFLTWLSSVKTLPGIIPQACSCRVHPLEVCVGPVLREFLQVRWTQLVTEAPQNLIGAGPTELALLFSAWLLEMLDVLAERPEFLQRSFNPALNSNSDLAPGEFSELVQKLTDVLLESTSQEQESEENSEPGDSRRMSPVVSSKTVAISIQFPGPEENL